MSDHVEDPVGHASTKVVQYVSLATMAAEALAQVTAQRAAARAATDQRTAAALRAEHTTARAAARTRWAPVLDHTVRAQMGVVGAGLAWAAAQGWREGDPEASLAAARATERLRELRPDVMDRYDRLTADGVDPIEVMRRVAPFMDRSPARPAPSVDRQTLTAGPDPAVPLDAEAEAARRAAGEERGTYAQRTHVGDDPTTPGMDERRDAAVAAETHLDEAATLSGRAAALGEQADLTTAPELSVSVAAGSTRTPPQVAHDAFPEPLTGEVLAAGKVKAKNPATTAPAAVRATTLATAARAGHRR